MTNKRESVNVSDKDNKVVIENMTRFGTVTVSTTTTTNVDATTTG
jgi:hypothetical protein